MALDINLIENVGALNIATPTILDKSPYLFRQTPQGAGNRVSPTLIGGSVGWNQLQRPLTSTYVATNSNMTVTYDSTGISAVVTTEGNSYIFTKSDYRSTFPANHVALVTFECKQDNTLAHNYAASLDSTSVAGGFSANIFANVPVGQWAKKVYAIKKTADITSFGIRFAATNTAPLAVGDSFHIRNLQTFDLTLMFGSTIADYIYSLGEGEKLPKLQEYGFFTKPYYPYDAGSMQSVKTTGRQTRNSNDEIIATYPLDDIDLRGIPKLDASNNLYYDGDTYEADGSVTRKYGVVDLGTLSWSYNSTSLLFYTTLNTLKTGYVASAVPLRCSKYESAPRTGSAGVSDKQIGTGSSGGASNTTILVMDSAYSDAATFKTAMSGVYLVYELATPTTETADPYTTPQIVGATEEFLDERTVPVPVGQESQYRQTQPYGLKIRLMEEGISIVNSSPLLRSASAPVQNTEEDTKTVKEPIEDIVKEPVDEKDTVKELPEDENEPEPEDEEVTEDDNERTDL